MFNIESNDVTLETDKSSYSLGEDMAITYTSSSGINFDFWDYIRIFPGDVTDYDSFSQRVYGRYLYQVGDYDASTGVANIHVNWDIDPTASTNYHRAVLYLGYSGPILGVSDVFDVVDA